MPKADIVRFQEAKERLEAILNTVIDGIITINERGVIQSVNPAACSLFGYEKPELIGENINILMPAPYHSNHDQYIHNYLETKQAKIIGIGRDVEGRRKDGKTFPIRLAVSETFLNNERIFTGIIHDMTKEKKAEEEILSLNATLEQKVEKRTVELEKAVKDLLLTNRQLENEISKRKEIEKELIQRKEELNNALKLERELGELKSRFVSMASHEFRTPLSTILSSASLVGKYTQSEQQPNREKHVERIKNSVNNLNTILNDFLSLAKIEEGKVEVNVSAFDICEFCVDTIDEISGLLKPGQTVERKGAESLIIYSDQALLKNIFYNLLSNATKYSPENTIIECNIYKKDKYLHIEVKDEGIGIPEKDQEFLFERFFRAKNASNIQGTGLGLNIVKRYVEILKGTITFKSEERKGTSFYIKLPINYG